MTVTFERLNSWWRSPYGWLCLDHAESWFPELADLPRGAMIEMTAYREPSRGRVLVQPDDGDDDDYGYYFRVNGEVVEFEEMMGEFLGELLKEHGQVYVGVRILTRGGNDASVPGPLPEMPDAGDQDQADQQVPGLRRTVPGPGAVCGGGHIGRSAT